MLSHEEIEHPLCSLRPARPDAWGADVVDELEHLLKEISHPDETSLPTSPLEAVQTLRRRIADHSRKLCKVSYAPEDPRLHVAMAAAGRLREGTLGGYRLLLGVELVLACVFPLIILGPKDFGDAWVGRVQAIRAFTPLAMLMFTFGAYCFEKWRPLTGSAQTGRHPNGSGGGGASPTPDSSPSTLQAGR